MEDVDWKVWKVVVLHVGSEQHVKKLPINDEKHLLYEEEGNKW